MTQTLDIGDLYAAFDRLDGHVGAPNPSPPIVQIPAAIATGARWLWTLGKWGAGIFGGAALWGAGTAFGESVYDWSLVALGAVILIALIVAYYHWRS